MSKDQKTKLQEGTLYMVALPIGNPNDISEHAKTVLSLADHIAAEDTRTFKDLCSTINIQPKSILAYHEHNEKNSAPELIRFLKSGQTVAIVSDAGTPNVSDPGHHILSLCFQESLPVRGVPGASSLTYALSVCPIGGRSHYFGGFAPSSSNDRKAEFQSKATIADRIVYFESPHRLVDHLEDAKEFFVGNVMILRELTKTYEEHIYLPIEDAIATFQKKKPQGEFVIIYPKQEPKTLTLDALKKLVGDLVRENLKASDILKRVQDLTALTRREIYDLITEIKHGLKNDK